MHNICKTLIIMFLLIIAFAGSSSAANITKIDNLINNMEQFDGKVVNIEGEAIGEAMNRGRYSWINVNDGTNAIGIWLESSDAAKITSFGDYKHIGDTVRISGVFSKNSLKHSGEVEIACSSLTIVQKGHFEKEQLTHIKIFSATLLFCLALMFSYIYARAIQKNKSNN